MRRWAAPGRLLAALVCGALLYMGLHMLSQTGGVRLDFTAENLTRLSEGTIRTLEGLEEPVHLYLVYQETTDTDARTMLEAIADSYAGYPRVSVETLDPVAEPGRIAPYQTAGESIQEGSVVVASEAGDRYAVIPAREMFAYRMSASGAYVRTGIQAEQKLTNAIRRVSGAERVNVYMLTGHGETGMSACTCLVSRLEAENYAVSEIRSGEADTLKAGDVLVVLSPAWDMTEQEYASISAHLDRGGRLLFACDASVDLDALPHFKMLAQKLSLRFPAGVVVEDENRGDYWAGSPLYLMPELAADSEALRSMPAQGRVILPGARCVAGPDIPLSGYSYEPLLLTSDGARVERTQSGAHEGEETDAAGRRQLAVAVDHAVEGTEDRMRAVLMGSLYTLTDNSLLDSTVNLDFSVALFGYLAEREDAVYVPVREIGDTSMPIPSASDAMALLGLTLCLPLCAAVVGTAVMLRRRRK